MKARAMLEWLILHTAAVLALAGLVLALGRWRRLGPAVRHALWLVVLVKFLTPPLLHWPWALPALAPAGRPAPASPAEEDAPAAAAPAWRVVVVAPAEEGPPPSEVPALPPVEERPAVPEAPAAEGPPGRGWRAAALLAWLAGGLVVAGAQAAQALRVRRLLGEGRPAPAWLEEAVGEAAAALGVRPPRARVLPGLGSPLVWGLGRPCLLWPQGLEEQLSPEGRRAVLVHELAHLRRRDHWVGWLLLAGACVWWWHPLYRLVWRRLGREAELACDAWVVRTLPGARRAFAEALLEVCQRRSPVVAAPALGAAGGRHDLERRLVMVMRERVPCRVSRRAVLGVVVLALLALPAWTLGQVASPTPKDTAPGAAAKKAVDEEVAREGAAAVELAAKRLGERAKEVAPAKAKAAPVAEQDKKLRELEEKVAALLKEVHALRQAGATGKAPGPAKKGPDADKGLLRAWYLNELAHQSPPRATTAAPVDVALRRTTYRLPAAKAEALGKFLREHVKAAVLEVTVEGDRLTVTTTPGVQRAIGEFVGLVVDPKAKRPVYSQPAAR
jgi:beta-lactamase regulating signal transducer with metallopeptidase domain